MKKKAKVIKMHSPHSKYHSWCEGDSPCSMNYCDENGCQERKRNLVEPKDQDGQIKKRD